MGTILFCDLNSGRGEPPQFIDWRLEQVGSGDEVRAHLSEAVSDVVMVRSRGNDPEALALLREVGLRYRNAVRIHLNSDASARYVSQAGDVAEYALSANLEPTRIEHAIERALMVKQRLAEPALLKMKLALAPLASLPKQIDDLNTLIDQQVPESTTSVAAHFRGCPELLKALMTLLNAPCFGFDRHLFSVDEAVRLLGLRALRDLTLLTHALLQTPQPEGWSSFSFTHQQVRALVCARLAERIALDAQMDRIGQGYAFQAGLMHDFGIRMLVRHDPERYHALMERASALNQPVYVLEKLEFGVTHADVSAAMLADWGISPRVIKTVLYHHVPKAADDGTFTPLTALHVADALLRPLPNPLGANLGGRLSLGYLDHILMADKVVIWEQFAADASTQLEAHL